MIYLCIIIIIIGLIMNRINKRLNVLDKRYDVAYYKVNKVIERLNRLQLDDMINQLNTEDLSIIGDKDTGK